MAKKSTRPDPIPLEDMFDELSTKQKMISMGWQLIDRIIKRTIKGVGVEGKFKAYSTKGDDPYWLRKKRGEFTGQALEFKPSSASDVNLVLTQAMLNSFMVKKGQTSDSQVTIGFPAAQSHKAFFAEKQGRAIATEKNPVTTEDQDFIDDYWNGEIEEGFKAASGSQQIVVG